MVLLIQYTIIFTSVLMLVALGGCFAEHSGVINLGLEGIMVLGSLGGALVMRFFPNLPGPVMIIAVLAGAIIFGMLYSCLLGVAAINFKADQTIVGTAMNMLSVAAATVFVKAMNTAANPDDVSSVIQYNAQKQNFLLKVGGFEFNIFMLVAVVGLVVAYLTLYKTKFGLRLMACGEHPQAADSVGINVYKMRWAGVLISGIYGGLGGITYIMAVMIFGQWNPLRICLTALLFGLFRALASVYSGIDFLANLNIPSTLYNMLPYIISLVVLALTSKNSRAPKAEGIPYDKGQR